MELTTENIKIQSKGLLELGKIIFFQGLYRGKKLTLKR